MTRKMGFDHDIMLKYSTNVSNRHILKGTKFHIHNIYEKKVMEKYVTGGINWGDKIIPPPGRIGLI